MIRTLAPSALVWAALATPAAAQDYIETQFDEESVTALLEVMLSTNPLCAAPCMSGEPDCVLDHIEVAGTVSLLTLGVPTAMVPVDLYEKDCVGEVGCTATVQSELLPLQITVAEEDDQWELCFEQTQLGLIRCEPLLATGMDELAPDNARWGVAVPTGSDRMALRFGADDTPAQAVAWNDFELGLSVVPLTGDGSVYLGKDFLLSPLTDMVTEGMPDDIPLEVGQPSVIWNGYGPSAQLILEAPVSHGTAGNVGAMFVTGWVSHAPTPFACGTDTCTTLLLDIELEADLDYPLLDVLLPGISDIAESVLKGQLDAMDEVDLPGFCTATSGWTATCAVAVPTPGFAEDGPHGPASMGFVDVEMHADWFGIWLLGDLTEDIPVPSLDIDVNQPDYGDHGTCNNVVYGWDGHVAITGNHGRCEVDLDHTGYWNPQVSFGTVGNYTDLGLGTLMYDVNPNPPQLGVPFGTDPDLYVTAFTTAGIETVRVELPAYPDEEDGWNQEIQAAHVAKKWTCIGQLEIISVKLPQLEDLFGPVDPYAPVLRDRYVEVFDSEAQSVGVAAVIDLAFAHQDDGSFLTGTLATSAYDETTLSPFELRLTDEAVREGEALEEQLLEEGVFGRVELPLELGEEPGLYVEVWAQYGADYESSWAEMFADLEDASRGDTDLGGR